MNHRDLDDSKPDDRFTAETQPSCDSFSDDWDEDEPELPGGYKLGPYTIVRTLGRGGMGTVYKAQALDGQPVALKTLKAVYTSEPSLRERFLHEFAISRKLDHPHIARALDNGMAHGVHYFALEYVDGPSANELLESDELELADTVEIIRQACSALAYAHENGIVHRDIKPHNLVVGPGDQAKVIDFGIARRLRTDDTSLTMTNCMMGTPSYMSPEQRTDAKHVDHRTDIYSLGVSFYQMISGRLPAGLISLELVPEGLRRIITRSTAYEAGDRYASAGEMLADLVCYQTGGSVVNDGAALDAVEESSRLREVMIETLYPRELPAVEGLDLGRLYLPAGGVGGNYYDFVRLDGQRLGILVGNVADRPSLRGAFFLTMLRSAFRLLAAGRDDPGEVLKLTNDFIARERTDQFAALSYAIVDGASGEVNFACAGFRPGAVLRWGAESFESLDAEGLGLGIMEETEYSCAQTWLAPGELLLLSSSGVIETVNQAGQKFGAERFERMVCQLREASAAQLTQALQNQIQRFAAGVAQNDDLTVIAVKYAGK